MFYVRYVMVGWVVGKLSRALSFGGDSKMAG